MTTYFQLRSSYRRIYLLFLLIATVIFGFWLYEFRQAMVTLDERAEEILKQHQALLLERKSGELQHLFVELYQSTRTISLLPMVRGVRGENRLSSSEDVVAQGRFSIDAHRTLQQIYMNLQTNVRVSEIYYVLDGFDPARHVPFFMYDDLIAGAALAPELDNHSPADDSPPEVEDEEYAHFLVQLAWFRDKAPRFQWQHSLDSIPVRLSPVLRTCDNSQFHWLAQGNVRDSHGLAYAIPVYAQDSGGFKGMITAILRTNVLEAVLVGVPYLTITAQDEVMRAKEGWAMPPPSAFRLSQPEYGIDIYDRRNPELAQKGASSGGRLQTIKLDLKTGGQWELSHYLSEADIRKLVSHLDRERQSVNVGRIALLALLVFAGAWNFIMMHRTRQELTAMVHYDPLTQLPNRRLFLDQLDHGLARARRYQRKLALLFIDVPNFSAVNDVLGSEGGDLVLLELGRRLQASIRSSDTVTRVLLDSDNELQSLARLGGDQFAVIFEDMVDVENVSVLVERMQAAVNEPFEVGDERMDISVNIGVAIYPDDATTPDKLLICADSAMQECRKEAVSFFVYNDELRQRSEHTHRLSIELKRALERGQFELFYQPKVSLKDGLVVSLEALLRLRHPQLGLVGPTEFIPILERSGGIIDVGRWVIEQACRDLAVLSEAGFHHVLVSANVSVRQLRRGNFHETVADILARTNCDPQRLVLEMTESMMMENLEEGRQALMQLDKLGLKLAIDDFGTGYSSLTYLQHLPLTYLKLDKAFVDGIALSRGRHIVEAVLSLAQGLSLKTIAEGIETQEQRDMLAEIGCDMIQGYLLSKPVPLPEIIDWMRDYQWQHRPFAAVD